jgi:hypothetical protein
MPPRLNVSMLVQILKQHNHILYDLYHECLNIELSDRILHQALYIQKLIENLEAYLAEV